MVGRDMIILTCRWITESAGHRHGPVSRIVATNGLPRAGSRARTRRRENAHQRARLGRRSLPVASTLSTGHRAGPPILQFVAASYNAAGRRGGLDVWIARAHRVRLVPASGKDGWRQTTATNRSPNDSRRKSKISPGFLRSLVPLLHRLGLRTARDVLFFFPRDYEDLTRVCAIGEIDGSGPVSVCGVVEEVESRTLVRGSLPVRCADPGRVGSPACGLVQSAVHATTAGARAARDALGSAQAARAVLGNRSSARREPGCRRPDRRGARCCPSTRSRKACPSRGCAGSSITWWTTWPTKCWKCFRRRS